MPCSSDASSSPAAPPVRPSIRLSTSSWRIARPPSAPSAARIAISRRRVVARASCRLATFAVAASSSSPTAASSTMSGRRTSAVTAACMGEAVTADRSVAAEDGRRGHRRVRRRAAAGRSLGGSLQWRRVRPHGGNRIEHRQRVADDGRNPEREPGADRAIGERRRVRENADHGMRLAVEPHRAAEHGGIRAEALAPQVFRENDDRASRGGLVCLGEGRPDRQRHAQRLKQAGRCGDDANAFGIAGFGQRRGALGPRREAVDGARAVPPRMERRVAEGAKPRRVAAAGFVEQHEAVGIRPRQRLHQHTVGHREQQRGRADGQRHREADGQRVAALAPQQPEREAEIVKHDQRPVGPTPGSLSPGQVLYFNTSGGVLASRCRVGSCFSAFLGFSTSVLVGTCR